MVQVQVKSKMKRFPETKWQEIINVAAIVAVLRTSLTIVRQKKRVPCVLSAIITGTSQQIAKVKRNSKIQVKWIKCICQTCIYISVNLEEKEVSALLDTGSDITLIKKRIYDEFKKKPKITGLPTAVAGFGRECYKTYGTLETIIEINDAAMKNNCHIVGNSFITDDMTIGKDIIKKIDIAIIGGEISVKKGEKEYNIEKSPISEINDNQVWN